MARAEPVKRLKEEKKGVKWKEERMRLKSGEISSCRKSREQRYNRYSVCLCVYVCVCVCVSDIKVMKDFLPDMKSKPHTVGE